MDDSTLAKAIATSERSVDSLETWLFLFTALVVIGLAVEYVPAIWKLCTDWSRNRALLVTAIGGSLITIGVSGELIVQYIASSEATNLRDFNHQYAEKLRARNLELEQRIQPRRLSGDQANAIGAAIHAVVGKKVIVASYAFDAEGIAFAQDLQISFGQGGVFGPSEIGARIPSQPPIVMGVRVTGSDDNVVSTIKGILISVANIELSPDFPPPGRELMVFPNRDPETAAIVFVGVKPIKR